MMKMQYCCVLGQDTCKKAFLKRNVSSLLLKTEWTNYFLFQMVEHSKV